MDRKHCMALKTGKFARVLAVLTVIAIVGMTAIGGSHVPATVADVVSTVPSVTVLVANGTRQVSGDMRDHYAATAVGTIDDLLSSQSQALYMDKVTLESISQNVQYTTLLKSCIASGKIILVADMGPKEIGSILDIHSPSLRSTTVRYAVGMMYRNSLSGRMEVGGILVPVDAILSVAVPDLAADVVELCQRVLQHNAKSQQTVQSQVRPLAGVPYWSADIVITHLLENSPYGRYWESCTARQLLNDGDGTYDYWGLLIDQETRAGYSAYPPSTWRTSRLWTRADVGLYYGQLLYHHDPTTTAAGSTATVNISLSGCAWSWSFPLPDVSCIDHSSTPDGWAEWEFDYAPYSNAGTYTFVSQPGISVRTANGYRLCVHRIINSYWYQAPVETHFVNEWYIQF